MMSGKVDLLNTILIIISLVVAFYLPFQLFLIAYAVLGPLHYLTEINWLHEKKYFVANKDWMWYAAVFALIIVIPRMLLHFSSWFQKISLEDSGMLNGFLTYSNSLIFLWLLVCIALLYAETRRQIKVFIGISLVVVIGMQAIPGFTILVGLLIPTLIHVYLFTVVFMLFGSQRNKQKLGYFNVFLMVLCPLIIVFWTVDPSQYYFSDEIKSLFINSNFHTTNAKLGHLLGITPSDSFFFYEKAEIKLQIFIAFAYTYHYLNWFSKTTTIRWHNQLNTKKTLIILLVWIVLVSIFWYDYPTGFVVTLFFSLLHVLMEFPLNVRSVRGVIESISSESQD